MTGSKHVTWLFLLLACGAGIQTRADEGLWLYNQPPRTILKERYGFEPTAEWLEHVQKSSVNVGGASGSFVSPEGLLLSNQHVVSRAVERISTPDRNIVRDGYYAKTLREELPCPGLEVSVLLEIRDVTERVNAAVEPGLTDREAFLARRAAMAEIEKEAQSAPNMRNRVVTLFQGGQYHLYRSKRYTDVRLVMVPEEKIGFFGGDVDNFEFPRHDLDIAFLRVYENNRPARVEHFLAWSAAGAEDDELVFMSGHPARTDRLRTAAELAYLRDVEYPNALERLKRTEVLLNAYSKRSAENARQARQDLRSMENGRKRRDGTLDGLLDPALMRRKKEDEAALKSTAGSRTELAAALGAWDRIDTAQNAIRAVVREYDLLEREWGFNTVLFTHARRLVRAAAERDKPDSDRLEEYRSSALPSIELALTSDQPCYGALETAKLADSLTHFAEQLGAEHPLVVKVLDGKSPHVRGKECVLGTKLGSAAVRRRIYFGSLPAAGEDAMIDLARLIDEDARSARLVVDAQTEAIRQAHARIGQVRYALRSSADYPDATGTLRLGIGTVKAIAEPGLKVPTKTTFAGLFQRAAEHKYAEPFDLPRRWVESRRKLNLNTPFNFITTCDTLGGNSGSPVVNKKGELVGVVFDGNIHSLVLDVEYEETRARSVAVHSAGIIEALRKVYKAERLLEELKRAR
jgi:hypothetical protein